MEIRSRVGVASRFASLRFQMVFPFGGPAN